MLTRKMSEVLAVIDGHGSVSTMCELGQRLGCKHIGSLYRIVGALEQRGFIRRPAGRHGPVEVVKLQRPISTTDGTGGWHVLRFDVVDKVLRDEHGRQVGMSWREA